MRNFQIRSFVRLPIVGYSNSRSYSGYRTETRFNVFSARAANPLLEHLPLRLSSVYVGVPTNSRPGCWFQLPHHHHSSVRSTSGCGANVSFCVLNVQPLRVFSHLFAYLSFEFVIRFYKCTNEFWKIFASCKLNKILPIGGAATSILFVRANFFSYLWKWFIVRPTYRAEKYSPLRRHFSAANSRRFVEPWVSSRWKSGMISLRLLVSLLKPSSCTYQFLRLFISKTWVVDYEHVRMNAEMTCVLRVPVNYR